MGGDRTHSPAPPSFTHSPQHRALEQSLQQNTRVAGEQPPALLRGAVTPAHGGAGTEGQRVLACFTRACGFQLCLGGCSAHWHGSELFLEAQCFDGVCLSPTESGSN